MEGTSCSSFPSPVRVFPTGPGGSGGVQEIYRSSHRMSYGCHFAATSSHDSSVYVVEHDFKIYRLCNPLAGSPHSLPTCSSSSSSSRRSTSLHSPFSSSPSTQCPYCFTSDARRMQRQNDRDVGTRGHGSYLAASRREREEEEGLVQEDEEAARSVLLLGSSSKQWTKQLLVDVIPYLFCHYRKEYTKVFTGNKQFDIPRMQELRRSCCLMANSLDGMLYFFFHQTLFRISLSGVMTPVADLVQAAVNLLRENLVSPPVVSNASLPATASASPPVAVGDNSDCRRTARSTRREKRERRGGRRTHSSAEGRSRVRSKGKLTGATNENGDSSFSYGLQPTTGVGATADDDASSSPLRVSPRERRGDEEEETFWSDIRHFHTKLGGADPSVPLEVVSCCIDGRGWCFFTVQEKDPKVRRKVSGQRSGGVPANDAGDSNSSGGTSNTSDFSPEGVLLCLDTGAAMPVIRPVFFPLSVDPARVLLLSVAAHPLGGITCAVAQTACSVRGVKKRRRRRRRGRLLRHRTDRQPTVASEAELDRSSMVDRTGGRAPEEKEDNLKLSCNSVGGENAEKRLQQSVPSLPRRRRAAGIQAGPSEPAALSSSSPGPGQTTAAAGEGVRGDSLQVSESPCSGEGEDGSSDKRQLPQHSQEIDREEQGQVRPLTDGFFSFFSSSSTVSPSTDVQGDCPPPATPCEAESEERDEDLVDGEQHADEEEEEAEGAAEGGEEEEEAEGGTEGGEEEEEEEEEEERDQIEGRRSDWWLFPADEDEPWNLIPLMEISNHKDLHEIAQQTTLNFGGTLEDSVCIYAFDWHSACCWLLWQPGRSVREARRNRGEATVSLECAYLLRLPAEFHWRDAHRCLAALKEKRRRDRTRRGRRGEVEEEQRTRTGCPTFRGEDAGDERLPAPLLESAETSDARDRQGESLQVSRKKTTRERARERRDENRCVSSCRADPFSHGSGDSGFPSEDEEDPVLEKAAATLFFGSAGRGRGVRAPERSAAASGGPPTLLRIIPQDARHLEVREMLPTGTGHLLIMAETGNILKRSELSHGASSSPGGLASSRRGDNPPSSASSAPARSEGEPPRSGSSRGAEVAPRAPFPTALSPPALLPPASSSVFASLGTTLAWAAASTPAGAALYRAGEREEGDNASSTTTLQRASGPHSLALLSAFPGGITSLSDREGTASASSLLFRPIFGLLGVLPRVVSPGFRSSPGMSRQQASRLPPCASVEEEEEGEQQGDAAVLFLVDGVSQCVEASSLFIPPATSPRGGRTTGSEGSSNRHQESEREGGAALAAPVSSPSPYSGSSRAARWSPSDSRATSSVERAKLGRRSSLSTVEGRASGSSSLCCFCRLQMKGSDTLREASGLVREGCADGFSLGVAASTGWGGGGRLLLHETFFDVEIHCGDGVRLPSHRALLAARSPFFEAMLTGVCGWREQETPSGKKAGMWILELPSHRSRAVAPILGYFASDKLVIPAQCCCSRCCPFSRSRGSTTDFESEAATKKRSSAHGGRLYSSLEKGRAGVSPGRRRGYRCFRCMYIWLLELFACAQFCLVSSLQNEVLHVACRYINKHTALFALCHPLSGSHPRLLRYAAQMFFLHFPCPGELLRPLLPRIYSSASVASRYGDNRVPTDLSSALPEETASGSTFSTPHSLSEASPRTVTSREADEYNALRGPSVSTRERDHPGTDSRDPPGSWWGDVAPVVLVARPPVSAHLSFAINAWLMTSPVSSPVVGQLVQQLLTADSSSLSRRRLSGSETSLAHFGDHRGASSTEKAVLLFLLGYRICLGVPAVSPAVLLSALPLRSCPVSSGEGADGARDPRCGVQCSFGRQEADGTSHQVCVSRTVEYGETRGLIDTWGKLFGLSRGVRRKVETELEGILAAIP